MADLNAALVQQFLHVSVTQGKAMVEPNGLLDDEHRETVAVGLGVGHEQSTYPDSVKATQPDQLLPVQSVHLDIEARRTLTERLGAVGSWQGGSLFGQHDGHTVQVPLAFGLGVPGWSGHPLWPSLPFLIGVTEAIEATLGMETDWVGQWIAAPDGRLPDLRDDLLWLTLGGRQGLFTDRCPLVVIGLQDGYLHGRAYIWDEGEPARVDCLSDPIGGLS